MSFKQKILPLFYLLSVQHFICYGRKFTVYLNQNDIRGEIIFNQANENENVTIQFQPNESIYFSKLNWIIVHEPFYNGQSKCQDIQTQIGINLNSGFDVYSSTNAITLYGNLSIYGSTLLLKNVSTDQTLACGTILSDNDTYSFVHISSSVVAGSIHFLQNNGLTLIYGSLGPSDGSTASVEYYWSISSFNPCLNSTVQDNNFTALFWFPPSFSLISTLASDISDGKLVGMTLIVMDKSKKLLTCDKIQNYGPLQAQALFSEMNSINGVFSFKQLSPFHPTFVEIDLQGLDNKLNGYHVHMFPISDSVNRCSQQSVGSHFNPDQVDVKTSPQPGKGSFDKYEVGDLSGKYGTLVDKYNFTLKITDVSLQLYGFRTIIGRSIVIHQNDASSTRFVCANIEPAGLMISLLVNFSANPTSALDGDIILRQYIQTNDVITPTLMVLNVKYRNSSIATLNHNFHVHQLGVGKDTTICSSVLGHYNPAEVNISQPAYKNQCNQKNLYRCELGDTSSKVGTYNIGSGKAFYADADMPLFGTKSVLNRSITFHEQNRSAVRLGCADIVPFGKSVFTFTIRLKLLYDEIYSAYTILLNSLNLTDPSLSWKLAYIQRAQVDKACTQFTFYVVDDSVSNTDSQIYKDKIELGKANELKSLLKCDNDLCDIDEHCGLNGICKDQLCLCTDGFDRKDFVCIKKENRSMFIAGIVVPVLVIFIAILIILVIWYVRRVRTKKRKANISSYDNL